MVYFCLMYLNYCFYQMNYIIVYLNAQLNFIDSMRLYFYVSLEIDGTTFTTKNHEECYI